MKICILVHDSFKHFSFLISLFAFLFLFSCSEENNSTDNLNSLSYAFHYRDVDSTEMWANRALNTKESSESSRAEALNHLAFVAMTRMDYAKADSLLQRAVASTDNKLEQMVGYVQQMRLCQRRSRNREFYECRERAASALRRINEEREELSEHQLRRLRYAESEMAIVTSTYYYYVGLERQSIEALEQLDLDEIRHDTAQYLNYLYNVGAGGILTEGTSEEIHQEEMDYLLRCLSIAQRYHYVYFEAQAKEALAEHTNDLTLAEEALELFSRYGDIYQIAGAHRTLASCYHALGDEEQALLHLHQALSDSIISQAPDLVASIHEQLSVAYAAINNKQQSDLHRNLYIDLQEQTRQDRELEARADMLNRAVAQLNAMTLAVLGAIVLLLFLLWLFNRLHRKSREDYLLNGLLEQKNEELSEVRLRVERGERRHLEQRAKVSLAVSILPLIDRILYAADHAAGKEQLQYIGELTSGINQQNELLTQWIQLRQGEVSFNIESFPLHPLFSLISKNRHSFAQKGITLEVDETRAVVKADRVLTLFMLNTLADNARKYTQHGGSVRIYAEEQPDYVEISVSDTGIGMKPDELDHVFDTMPITDTSARQQASHRFGLLNCRGIIEKYRKLSRLFSVCLLSAESQQGKGSRFYFRLPKGVVRCLLIGGGMWLSSFGAQAQDVSSEQPLYRAHIYADSAYFSNINGTYDRTLLFADSCRQCLNDYYRQQYPDGRLLMTREGDQSAIPAEIQWLHDSLGTNYQIILDIRNESAVAALALHEWPLYAYNNKVYTQLFKELSADSSLDNYCRTMQQSQQNKRIAVILLLVLLVMIVPAYYMLYYRHRLYERYRRERLQQTSIEMAEDELKRVELEDANLHVANAVLDNCLSTLKHETMYYPSRIEQLALSGDMEALSEVTHYYRALYAVLLSQAGGQVEKVHLHLHPMELYGYAVLGDSNLLHYLFELLKPTKVIGEVKDERYLQFCVYGSQLVASNVHLADEGNRLQTLNYLLCRQIVRDHGEATNRRGCGIRTEENKIIIILPRYNGQV